LELGVHHLTDHAGQTLDGLQHDVSDKTVAHDDVDGSLADIVAFDVTVEIQTTASQQLGSLLDDFVTLDDFFTDVEQTDSGTLFAIQYGHQRRTHDGELQEMFGRAVDIGAQVEHGRGSALLVGYGRGDGGTIDTVERFEHIARNRHPCSGITGRHTGVCTIFLDCLNRHPHG